MEVKYRVFYLSIKIINFMDISTSKQSIRIVSDQLIRSTTSIGANIVEAKSSSSKREFLNYFQIALKSTNETKYWLALLNKLLPNKSKEISAFLKETDEIAKIIGASVLTMKGKRQL
jgi:four helix bundle protein